MTPAEILEELRQIKYDLSVTQTRVSHAIEHLAGLNLPDPGQSRCVECNIKFRGKLALAEHIYNHHHGPVPEHYLAAERAAGFIDERPKLEPGSVYWTYPKAVK